MNRKEIIKSDSYWETTISILLFNKNYKGKSRRKDFIDAILKIKNELIVACEDNLK